ncbi:MAG: aldo/keto reductase [Myxococcales bacterium]|nr:aldo/keto reductase [Myxococcales bacterium]
MTASLWDATTFGRSGLSVSRLAVGSSYGVGGADLERARERGINFFFWGLRRTDAFADGLHRVCRTRREELCVAVQTYSRSALLIRPSVELALRKLKLDYVDLLTLSWWSDMPPDRIVDAALTLRERGKVRQIMISCHHRPSFARMIDDSRFDAIMLRYNAAHPGAEREVFPHLQTEAGARPGVLAFTATRWGSLLRAEYCPKDERTPTATDCYRFVLSNPAVDVAMCGPKNGAELDDAMKALELGRMSEEELGWMRRVGETVHQLRPGQGPVSKLDKLSAFFAGRARDEDRPTAGR